MDVGLSTDPVQSFRLFQSRVLDIYDRLADEVGLRVVDATGDIPPQQKAVRRMVQEVLRGYERPAGMGNGNGGRR
jgi:dTMP kinase